MFERIQVLDSENYSKKHISVCHFSTVHKPFDVRIYHREAISLSSAGYKIILLTHAPFRKKNLNGVMIMGVPIPTNRWKRFLDVFKFYFYCRRIGANIFQFHDLELLPVGYLLKISTGAKVIYDCHENYRVAAFERVWYPKWWMPLISLLIAKIEPFLARRLAHVICVVPEQQKYFQAHGCHTSLIRNLPRLANFSQPNNSQIARQEQLVYLGGLSIARGAKVMVEIMAMLRESYPHIKLLCLGAFNEPFVEEHVREYAKNRAVDDIIEFHPPVPHEEVPIFLYRSKVAILPWQPNPQMDMSCYPNKVFEYWACGLPIVASDLPGLRPLLSECGGAILVPPNQPEEFVNAILYLLNNPNIARTLGEQGRKIVYEKFNWEKEEKKLLNLYDNLAKLSKVEQKSQVRR